MLLQFLNHINASRLILPNQKVLLAVSGGIDSMVMLDLFRQSPFEIAVAHCNFQLRGEASDKDEEFVKIVCDQHQIPFYSKRFATQPYSDEQGISIQMAARDLRYNWFAEVLRDLNFDWIATAHHLNDNIETVLLNLVRGTGLDGLTGIPAQNGNIIRPLLSFTKISIEEYAKGHSIKWRDDVSNESDYYDRNFIRQQVVPLLKKLNPAFEDGFKTTQERLMGAKGLTTEQITQIKNQYSEKNGNLSIAGIKSSVSPAVVLWYLIKEHGFSFDQCKRIIEPHETGKSFYSTTHRLTIDRGYYILSERTATSHESVAIEDGLTLVKMGANQLTIKRIDEIPAIEKNQNLAMLNAETLEFPLCWRKWQAGDQFVPLGMNQHKKVSDFLIDEKVSLPDKERVTVLESGGKICWVVGYRISDLYKITPATKQAIIIRNIH